MQEKEEKSMKKQLQELVSEVHKNNPEINLVETPMIFTWSYDEDPEIEYQLLIKQLEVTLH